MRLFQPDLHPRVARVRLLRGGRERRRHRGRHLDDRERAHDADGSHVLAADPLRAGRRARAGGAYPRRAPVPTRRGRASSPRPALAALVALVARGADARGPTGRSNPARPSPSDARRADRWGAPHAARRRRPRERGPRAGPRRARRPATRTASARRPRCARRSPLLPETRARRRGARRARRGSLRPSGSARAERHARAREELRRLAERAVGATRMRARPLAARAPRAPAAVRVRVRVARRLGVDDARDVLHVDARAPRRPSRRARASAPRLNAESARLRSGCSISPESELTAKPGGARARASSRATSARVRANTSVCASGVASSRLTIASSALPRDRRGG